MAKKFGFICFLLSFLLAVISALLLVTSARLFERDEKVAKLEKDIEQYRTMYRYIVGDSKRFGKYRIFTPDGGESWYDVILLPITDERSQVNILGKSRPELVRYTQALDKIASRHNSLDLNRPEDRALIEDLGFEVLGEGNENPQ